MCVYKYVCITMESETYPFADANRYLTKRHLQNSSVIKKDVSLKRCTNTLRYTWSVGSYDELRTGMTYEHFVEKAFYSCIFRLEKTEKTLVLRAVLSGNLVDNGSVQVYISLSNGKPSNAEVGPNSNPLNAEFIRAIEERMGMFVTKFPAKATASRFACRGTPLFVLYHCVSRPREKPLLSWTGRIDKKSSALVSQLLSSEMNRSLSSDFRIVTRRKRTFATHKCILTARSGYFSEYFKHQGEVSQIEVDAYPGIVWYVLLYMYSGEIEVLDVNTMIQVLHLAQKWRISALVDSCTDYLRGNLDNENMKKALEIGQITCLELLGITKRLENLTLEEKMEASQNQASGEHQEREV